MNISLLTSIDEAGQAEWNQCLPDNYPFARFEFLQALESTGCVAGESGWLPAHLLVSDLGETVGIMPMYLKDHSWGEYVFDHEWAHAFARYGLHYYPKLVTSMPFSPVTGPRILPAVEQDADRLTLALIDYIKQYTLAEGLSSWHCLFPAGKDLERLLQNDLAVRHGCQFHWFNRGYESFEQFLERFSSRKRKAVRKERKSVAEQGVVMQRVAGGDMTLEDWRTFYRFYADTYFKRGHSPHLNLPFFIRLGQQLGNQIILDWAYRQGERVAVALFLRDDTTLYGRYWGCDGHFNGLHFEACFYRGIEYCIDQGLQRFDPGAQGEHKISRGFEPVETHSVHWVADSRFRVAIQDFVNREKQYVEQYRSEAATLLPFKKGEN